jgi:hypothetical protein
LRHSDAGAPTVSSLCLAADGRDNPPMIEQQDHREGQPPGHAVYVALGRFVVEFSQVVAAMQDGMIRVAAGDDERARTAWTAALSADVAADQTTRMFFAACSSLAELDDGEKQIRKLLRSRVEHLTKRRNAILHGVWHMPVLHVGPDKASGCGISRTSRMAAPARMESH